MRKIEGLNYFPKNTITAIGDSQVDLTAACFYGINAYEAWNPRLGLRLREIGCLVRERTFGKSGDTTAQVLGRAGILFNYDSSISVGIVYCGVNDPGSGITGTAVSGAIKTISLQSTASNLPNSYLGYTISITSGTGSGQTNTIIGYTITRVATVKNNWTVTPDSTSVYSISAPSIGVMQANMQALIKVFKFKVRGKGDGSFVHVWSQNDLPIGGSLGQRYIVMEDTSTTGGMAKNSEVMHDTIVGNYASSPKQSVWEFRSSRAGELGWGRVAIDITLAFEEGTNKVINMGSNYLNWPSGGDNYNVNTSTGTQYASYVPVRTAAQQAAVAEGTVYCDLYAFQSHLIYGGSFLGNNIPIEATQGSGDFHYIPSNQHYSAYGHDTVARALIYSIKDQDGWIEELSNGGS